MRQVTTHLERFQLDEPIVFINAWNEWAEGNHLEPDQQHGRGYLEATRRVIRQPAGASPPGDPSGRELKLYRLSTRADYYQYVSMTTGLREERGRIEKSLVPAGSEAFGVPGFCSICQRPVLFQVDYFAADTAGEVPIPNWRERLLCPGCGLNNRMRAAIHILMPFLKSGSPPNIYIAEQTTPVYGWLRSRFPGVIGSEYLGEAIPLGATDRRGIRNEDLTALTFPDQSFDLALTFEVFEHVADYRAAFRECRRILREGGTLLFSVPFAIGSPTNIVRAKVRPDGILEHLLPPEYHGDPLNQGPGCLCLQVFGWEMLEELKAAGFGEAYAYLYWSREAGLSGGRPDRFFRPPKTKK